MAPEGGLPMQDEPTLDEGSREPSASGRPHASELLKTPGALLLRTDLRDLGLTQKAVSAVFRELPVIILPGYARPMVRVEAYLALLEGSTYCDRCGDRVRPTGRGSIGV
jgi:hypothetical protein